MSNVIKGVAVPYIIAMILGIAVLSIIGYWFFVTGGKGGSSFTFEECRNLLVSYCTAWGSCGYVDNCNGNNDFCDEYPQCQDSGIKCIDNDGGATPNPDSVAECRNLLGLT